MNKIIANVATLLGADQAAEADALTAAVVQARVWDENGHAPNHPNYVDTYDTYLAAAAYVEAVAVRRSLGEQISSFSSEGSTFTIATSTPDDLFKLAARLRGMSPLAGTQGLHLIDIDNNGPWVPTSREARWSTW